MSPPVIGITVHNRDNSAASEKYECGMRYCDAVARAGGVPVMLPHQPDLAEHYVALCDGIILTGGYDADVRMFGQELHPSARLIDPKRQAFETALLRAVRHDQPVLGICLGMQMMALTAGGKLNQYLPETMTNADAHANDRWHAIVIHKNKSVLGSETCEVASSHRQAVASPGDLRIVATAPDGVIEAIDDPRKKFFLGVQWHPERGGEGALNQGLIERFIKTATLQ